MAITFHVVSVLRQLVMITTCDESNLWVHIKCNNLNFINYQYLNGNDDPWYCLKCNTEFFPFGTLIKHLTNIYINSRNTQNKNIDKDNSSNLVQKPPPNLNSLFNQFNNSSLCCQLQILQSSKSSNYENP